MTPTTTTVILDLKGFAARMKVSPNTVRNWIDKGKLVKGRHFAHDGERIYRFPWSEELFRQIMQDWNKKAKQFEQVKAKLPPRTYPSKNSRKLVFRA